MKKDIWQVEKEVFKIDKKIAVQLWRVNELFFSYIITAIVVNGSVGCCWRNPFFMFIVTFIWEIAKGIRLPSIG